MISAFRVSSLRDSELRRDYGFSMLPRTSWGVPTIALVIVLLATGAPAWAQSCTVTTTTALPAARSAPVTNLPAAQPAPTTNLPATQSAPGGNLGLMSGLVTYWKLDEASGTSATDSMSSHTGTWGGTLGSQWTTGKINGGGSFNGTNNYISASWNTLTLNADRTISAWFKTNNTAAANWVSWGANSSNQLSQIGIFSGGLGYLGYANDLTTTTSAINIGRAITASNYYLEQLDEVGIWNRALSASEVATLYNGSNGDPFGNSSCGFSH